MRGRKPKERKNYILRMGDGTLIEVTREIYLEWYQSKRKEKYQKERDKRYGVCSLEAIGEHRDFAIPVIDSLEETAIRNMYREKIQTVMEGLSDEDAYLIHLLYFAEVSVTEAAQLCGCSRKTVQNRRKRILGKLHQEMKKQGITGGSF